MRPHCNLITIGYDMDQTLSLRRAITALNRSGNAFCAWSGLDQEILVDPETARSASALLDSADAIFCHGLPDCRSAGLLAGLLSNRPDVPVIPVACSPEVVLLSARWGCFFTEALAPDSTESDDLCTLARLLRALHHPSPYNLETALRLLVWQLRPGSILEPPLPVAYPQIGFWHPDRGLHADWRAFQRARTSRFPATPSARILLLCHRSQIIGENDAHLRAAITALEARGIDVVPLFGDEYSFLNPDFLAGILSANLVVDASGQTPATFRNKAPATRCPVSLQWGDNPPVIVACINEVTGAIVPDHALVEHAAQEICHTLFRRRKSGSRKLLTFPHASGQ